MIDHPILGKLKPMEQLDGAYEGRYFHEGTSVATQIDPDGVDLARSLELACSVLANLPTHLSFASRCLVRDMLAVYNDEWREDDLPTVGDDDFIANFALKSVDIYGSGMVNIWFKDRGDFFWGHGVLVCWIDINDKESATAEIFG